MTIGPHLPSLLQKIYLDIKSCFVIYKKLITKTDTILGNVLEKWNIELNENISIYQSQIPFRRLHNNVKCIYTKNIRRKLASINYGKHSLQIITIYRYPKFSWISDIRNSFTDIQNSFMDIRNSFTDIRNSFTDIQNSFTDIQNSAELRISNIHLRISEIHLRISKIHLRISIIHLRISEIHLRISENQLNFQYPKTILTLHQLHVLREFHFQSINTPHLYSRC